jgi:hypothetical protein
MPMAWRRRVGRVAAVLVLLALLGSSAPPPPLRAESASACYSQLKTVRARAKLPAVSSTRLPALATAAQRHATYRVNADAARLADQSAHYETEGRAYFTGVRPWDRTAKAGLKSGSWRQQNEDMTTGVNIPAAALQGVQSWIDAPYHRFPILDANMRDVGCAVASLDRGGTVFTAEVLEMAQPYTAKPTKAITPYPAAGQTGVPTAFNRLLENPRPFGTATTATVGYVVSVQAAGYQAMRVSRFALYRGTTAVPAYLGVRYAGATSMRKWVDSQLPATAAMLAAKAPLAARTTYTAKIAGAVRATPSGAWTSFTRSWTFTTA